MLNLLTILMTCLAICNTSLAQAPTAAQLMQAVRQGNAPIVARLIKQLPIDTRDEHARTAVHYAVENGQVEILDALLYGGADPNIIDANGDTPYDLWERHASDNADIARILRRGKAKSAADIEQELFIQDSAVYTKRNAEMLFQAAAAGARDEVEQLLEAGTDPKTKNAEGLFPFHIAVQNKHPAVAAILLRAMSDINGSDDKSWTALHWAVLAKDWDMVRGLLREQANFRYKIPSPTRSYQDPYDIAERSKTDELFIAIIFAEQRDDIVNTLAEKAVRDGNISLLEQLTAHGLDLTQDKKLSSSVLQIAMRAKESMQMLPLLLEYGIHKESVELGFVDIYRRNYHLDKDGNRASIVKLFKKHGVDPNALAGKGDTPLLTVIKKTGTAYWGSYAHNDRLEDDIADIKDLLAYRADINATNANGKTALMLLADATLYYGNNKSETAIKVHQHRVFTLMKFLLEHGADPNIIDNNNLTALDYAKKKKPANTEVIKLLEQHTAS